MSLTLNDLLQIAQEKNVSFDHEQNIFTCFCSLFNYSLNKYDWELAEKLLQQHPTEVADAVTADHDAEQEFYSLLLENRILKRKLEHNQEIKKLRALMYELLA